MPDVEASTRGARSSRRSFLAKAGVLGAGLASLRVHSADQAKPKAPELRFSRTQDALNLSFGQQPVFKYQLARPASGGSTAESACYFHPLVTPKGTVVTEIGPSDHPHHRGVFLAWLQVEAGADRGDFWGWGEPAPTANRRIVHRKLEGATAMFGAARFRAENDWQIAGRRILAEDLRVTAGYEDGATYLNLAVQFQAEREVRLARWGFGGFAVRVPKGGQVAAWGPAGPVKLPPPKHTDPASNWPESPWHALHLKMADGREATVMVANRRQNPPTTWHVVAGIGLINPCITAAGPVTLKPGSPMVLRYRVMAFDGPPQLDVLERHGRTWHDGAPPA